MGGALLQVAHPAADVTSGYGAALLQTLSALVLVCVLAWVLLRWGAKRGLGLGQGQRMRVIERVALDARRSLFLVEVAGKVLLLGVGDGSAPTLLSEIDKDQLPADPPARAAMFSDVLKRFQKDRDEAKPS